MEKLQRVGRGLAVSTSAYVTNIASRFPLFAVRTTIRFPASSRKRVPSEMCKDPLEPLLENAPSTRLTETH